jgi:hypothetical protein
VVDTKLTGIVGFSLKNIEIDIKTIADKIKIARRS